MRFGLRELVFLLVLLGMPIATYAFVFRPMDAKNEQIRASNQERQQKLDRLEVAQHIEDVGEEIEELKSVIAMFEDKLPAEKEVEVILKEVWEVATSRGLRPKSVRTGKAEKGPLYSELPIEMEIVGDFDGFYSFLLDLERLSRITRVPEMELEKSRDTEGHMVAEFTLLIFFEPDDESEKGA